MDLLLRFKPWHLFFLMLIIPSTLSTFSNFPGIWQSVTYVIYTGWIYAVGVKMNALLPIAKKPGIKLFKIQCGLLIGIILFTSNILAYSQFSPFDSDRDAVVFAALFLIVIYLEFSIWMFAGRMLESMIEGEIVNRSDALKAFFCFCFFPIGIWYIQPAVQRVLAKYEAPDASNNLPA